MLEAEVEAETAVQAHDQRSVPIAEIHRILRYGKNVSIARTILEEEMQTPFEGGCMCGEVRYRCEAEPGMTYYCHCEDCRRGSGSAFHVGLGVSKDAVTVLKGELKSFRKEADSGRGITRMFCPTCGSPLFTYPDVWPDIVMIKAGSVDEPELFEPNIEIYTDSKVSWAQISPTVESYPKGRA